MPKATANSAPSVRPPWQFKPGQSGNPSGRPKQFDLAAMCRKHAPEAVATLVAALSRPKDAVPAAIALLDRGFGRPKQTIETNDPNSPMLLHLLAAQAVSRELTAEREQRERSMTIDGHTEPSYRKPEPATTRDLLSQPPPSE